MGTLGPILDGKLASRAARSRTAVVLTTVRVTALRKATLESRPVSGDDAGFGVRQSRPLPAGHRTWSRKLSVFWPPTGSLYEPPKLGLRQRSRLQGSGFRGPAIPSVRDRSTNGGSLPGRTGPLPYGMEALLSCTRWDLAP